MLAPKIENRFVNQSQQLSVKAYPVVDVPSVPALRVLSEAKVFNGSLATHGLLQPLLPR